MNEKKPDNETVVRQDAPGEDWLNGRGAFCGRCGGKDNKPTVAWDASEGCVRCSECVYINPDATREAVLYLLEQRVAGAEELSHVTKRFGDLAKATGFPEDAEKSGFEAVVEFARVNREALVTADRVNKGYSEKVKKLEADLARFARANSKTAKVEDKPEKE